MTEKPADLAAWAISEIVERRKTQSRRELSELTTLGQGKIYRIENGTVHPDEAELIWSATHPTLDGTPDTWSTVDEAHAFVAEPANEEVPPPPSRPEGCNCDWPVGSTTIPHREWCVAYEPPPSPGVPVVEFQAPVEVPEPPAPPLDTEQLPTLVQPFKEAVPPFTEAPDASVAPGPDAQLPDFADGVRRVSNSEVRTFKRCRRKWWLSYHRGLRPKTENPLGSRAVGDRGHRALRRYYATDPSQRTDPRDALEREIIVDWNTLWQHYAAQGWDNPPQDELDVFRKSVDMERVIIAGYVEWLADTGADANLEVVAPETYVEAELLGTGVTLIGKIDVRVRRTYDQAVLFIDHKFVGSIGQAAALLPMNEQMKWYHLLELFNALPNGDTVVGALYNMLRRVKRTAAANPPFYSRVEVHHNPYEIQEFGERIRGTVRDITQVQEALAEGGAPMRHAYPNPTPDCAWDCPFLKVCPMFDDGSRVEDALSAHYVQGDPYDYYRKELVA